MYNLPVLLLIARVDVTVTIIIFIYAARLSSQVCLTIKIYCYKNASSATELSCTFAHVFSKLSLII